MTIKHCCCSQMMEGEIQRPGRQDLSGTGRKMSLHRRGPAADPLSALADRSLTGLPGGKDRRKLKIPPGLDGAAPAALCNYQQCNQRIR